MSKFRLNTPDEIIEIVQAFRDGKPIQYLQTDDSGEVWYDTTDPGWDFMHIQYRIKPQRPRAGFGKKYFYITSYLSVVWTRDGDSEQEIRYAEDTDRYESGNYFLNQKDAEAFLDKIKALIEIE